MAIQKVNLHPLDNNGQIISNIELQPNVETASGNFEVSGDIYSGENKVATETWVSEQDFINRNYETSNSISLTTRGDNDKTSSVLVGELGGSRVMVESSNGNSENSYLYLDGQRIELTSYSGRQNNGPARSVASLSDHNFGVHVYGVDELVTPHNYDFSEGKIYADNKEVAFTNDIPSLDGYATQTWVENKGYLTDVPENYISKNESGQINFGPSTGSDKNTVGHKSFWYKDFHYLDDNNEDIAKASCTRFSMVLCDAQGNDTEESLTGAIANTLVSDKADYSCSFIGHIISADDSTKRIIVQLDIPIVRTYSNWNPDWYAYDFGGTFTIEGITYIFDENRDYYEWRGTGTFGQRKKTDDGYLWFPTLEIGELPMGSDSVCFGTQNHANELGATAFGWKNLADGRYSLVTGRQNQGAFCTLVGGFNNKAFGLHSVAANSTNSVYGTNSVVFGYNNTVSGTYSFAEGTSNSNAGKSSHAEGQANTLTDTANQSHAEGYGNTVSGQSSHVEGAVNNDNSKYCSHVEGYHNLSGRNYQHVQGKWNKEIEKIGTDKAVVDVVGWGDNEQSRKNISVLDKDGNLHIKGDVYYGATTDDCTDGFVYKKCKKQMQKKDDITFDGAAVTKTYTNGLSDVVVRIKLNANTATTTYPAIRLYNNTQLVAQFTLQKYETAKTSDTFAFIRSIYDEGVRYNDTTFNFDAKNTYGQPRVYANNDADFMVICDLPVDKIVFSSAFVAGMSAEVYGRDW